MARPDCLFVSDSALIRPLSPPPKLANGRQRKRRAESATLLTSSPRKLLRRETVKSNKSKATAGKGRVKGWGKERIKGQVWERTG